MLSETTPLVTYTLYFTLYKLQRPQFKSAKWNHTLRCAFGEYDNYVRFSIFWMTCIWFYFYFFNLISRYYKIFTDVSFSFEFFLLFWVDFEIIYTILKSIIWMSSACYPTTVLLEQFPLAFRISLVFKYCE